jgi:hypothetical protein
MLDVATSSTAAGTGCIVASKAIVMKALVLGFFVPAGEGLL